jgi:hypothetical protein
MRPSTSGRKSSMPFMSRAMSAITK